MTNETLRTKVREVIVQTFEIKNNTIPECLDADSVEAWDSLGHMVLIERLEAAFNVVLDHSEVVQMVSEDTIVELLSAKTKAN